MKLLYCTAQSLHHILKGKRMVCFGAGDRPVKLCDTYSEYRFEEKIDYFFDNGKAKWGKKLKVGKREIPILPPVELENLSLDNHIIVITSDYYDEIFRQIRTLKLKDGNVACYVYPFVRYNYVARMEKVFRTLPLKEVLVFQSDTDYTDNAKVLFEYLLKHKYNQKYKLVWAVRDVDKYKFLEQYDNVKVFSYLWNTSACFKETLTYYYYLSVAKMFLVTHNFFWLRNRRPGQKIINLWHGCGYKRSKSGRKNVNDFDYTMVTGPIYRDVQADYFGCDRKKVVVTGLPKDDLLFRRSGKDIAGLLHIKRCGKYVVWMPTFRNSDRPGLNEHTIACETGLPIVYTEQELEELNRLLADRDMMLIIKLHQYQRESVITKSRYSNIVIVNSEYMEKAGIHIYTVLADSDALITDYSSTAVDYMLCDKPMAFALDDYEEFHKGRNFLFDDIKEYLPGSHLYTFDDLKRFLLEIADGLDSTAEFRRRLMPQFHAWQDANSCKRVVDFLKL